MVSAGDDPGQPVAAEQDPVTRLDLADRQVGLGGVGAVQDAGEHVALRVCGRLLLGEPSGVDERLHEGVVAGDALELAVAQQVAARVADVDQAEPARRRAGPR